MGLQGQERNGATPSKETKNTIRFKIGEIEAYNTYQGIVD